MDVSERNTFFEQKIKAIKSWWLEVLLDWAFQTAPKDTHNGKVIREMIAAYEDTFKH